MSPRLPTIIRTSVVTVAVLVAASLQVAAAPVPPSTPTPASTPVSTSPTAAITGTITGRIFAAGSPNTPVTDEEVIAFDPTQNREYSSLAGLHGGPSTGGVFTISGLPAGTYRLQYESRELGNENVQSPYWSGAATFSQAPKVIVADGQAVTVPNVVIPAGAVISGTVTSAGAPVPNASLNLFAATATGAIDAPIAQNLHARTDSSGNYRLAGLRSGSYTLEAHHDHENGLLDQWWKTGSSAQTANLITLSGRTVMTANITMQSGGSISGRVSRTIDGATAALPNAIIDAISETGLDYPADAQPDGSYLITGLPAGNYTVDFQNSYQALPSLAQQWYGGSAVQSGATRVKVGLGSTTSGIDGNLSAGSTISGVLTESDGSALATSELVNVYQLDPSTGRWTISSGVTTEDGDGHYELTGLADGTYALQFANARYDVTYAEQYWPQKTSLATATPIVISGATQLSGYDASLVHQAPPVTQVTGEFESITSGPSSITVSGYAVQPNQSVFDGVQVTIDGRPMAWTYAGDDAYELLIKYPAMTVNHGFTLTYIGQKPGKHQVCIEASTDQRTLGGSLGCRTVTVQSGSPIGVVDSPVFVTGRTVTIAGWAFDPDQRDPISVRMTVDGRTTTTAVADGDRVDMPASYADYGLLHGFALTGTVASGKHSVCAVAIDVWAGSNTKLGCVTVKIP